MNVKPKFVYYDIRRKQSVCLIMYTHENDVDTQVLEVSMLDNGEPIELSVDYTYSAAIVNRDTRALIDDSVPCELNDSGNVLIPIDNFHTLGAQDLLIELTVTDAAGNQVLVTPFPLWIHVNASILDDAQITPESQGTVPELLEDAEKALEDAQQAIENAGDYNNLDNKPSINGHELVGNKTGDSLGLQNKLTAGENITINANGEISASGGVTSYTELADKPQIEGHELLGNKTANDLGLQQKLFFNSNRYNDIENGQFKFFDEFVLHSGGLSTLDSLNNFPMNSIIFILDPTSIHGVPSGRKSTPALVITQASQDEYSRRYHIVQEYISWGMYPYTPPKKYIRTGLYEYGHGHDKWYYDDWFEENINFSISSAAVNQNGTITFTMSDGSTVTTTGESVIGPQGDDYVLTPQDKSDIAAIVLSELPTTQGVQYGNTSN